MTGPGPAERLLRRDTVVLTALIGALFVLTALYIIAGVGMRMTALEMTAMRGTCAMPGTAAPGQWSAGYALFVFLM